MNPLNPYLTYKRDTSRLIFWVIRVSNTIIRTSKFLPEYAPRHANTTGEVTVATLVALSKLIGSRVSPVPKSILSLFDSVIQARTESYDTFQQISSTDAEVERSNASHKHFIDALVEAFNALGGAEYIAERDAKAKREETQRADKGERDTPYHDEEDLAEALFSNKFAALGLDDSDEDAESGSDGEQEQGQATRRRQQKRPTGKGKKGKGKGGKKKKGTRLQQPPKATHMDDIPVDLYRFTQDADGELTDYFIAIYALFQEIAGLRCYVQAQWRDVAYHGMNAAIAGALSQVCVNFVQRTAAAIFLDFPRHDSYEALLNALTRGDISRIEGLFTVVVHPAPPKDMDINRRNLAKHFEVTEPFIRHPVNVHELFLLHTFEALVDFVNDFQKTRSGKPTKAMLQEINGWDPNFKIEQHTPEERLKWRRSFTINWLYDLVNVYSSVVIEHNKAEGNKYPLEEVDWSMDGPWEMYRRLYGLNVIAGFITGLCMMKQGTEFRSRIQPHHVFELQCIVDSMTMSRGWIATGLVGHSFRDPPKNHDAQREIKLFLDPEFERTGQSFLQPVDLLTNLMYKDGLQNNDPTRNEANYQLLKSVEIDFRNTLGKSSYFREGNIIPPSRFGSNVDGMWDYCPYLCGVGLEEAMREAYHRSLVVFDKIQEPLCLIHLHNMLLKRGFITQPISLFATLQELFPEAFYLDAKAPTKKFSQAFKTRIQERRTTIQPKTRSIEDFWTLRRNTYFKRMSMLLQLHAAGWNPDRISDSEVTMPSTLALHRVSQNRPLTDPKTGTQYMEDTVLIKRAREIFTEQQIVDSVIELPRRRMEVRGRKKKKSTSIIPENFTQNSLARAGGGRKLGIETTVIEYMEVVKQDICTDIRGTSPLSGANYVWIMVRMMALFCQLEGALSEVQNPVYLRGYREGTSWGDKKRVGFTYLALDSDDDECLRIMAREFESPRAGFMQHIFWDDLDLGDPERHFEERGGSDPFEACTIM